MKFVVALSKRCQRTTHYLHTSCSSLYRTGSNAIVLPTFRHICTSNTSRINSLTIGKSIGTIIQPYNTYSKESTIRSLSLLVQQQMLPNDNYITSQQRTMGSSSNKQSKNQKNKAKQKSTIKKQKLQQQQQKLLAQQRKQQHHGGGGTVEETTSNTTNEKDKSLDQHSQWVEFQKSIVVDGFETGQTLTVNEKGRSGGKAASKKRLTKRDETFMKIKERQRLAGGGGGEFPPMRYSEEETERLLIQAYSAIPPRTGKRGTLQLKRQKRRWHLVKEIRRKYKNHIIANHARVLEKRKVKLQNVLNFIRKEAPVAVQEDIVYQQMVRERYMQMIKAATVKEITALTSDKMPSSSKMDQSNATIIADHDTTGSSQHQQVSATA